MKNTQNTLAATLRGIEIKYGIDKFAGMIAGAYALWLARKTEQVDIANFKKFLREAENDELIRLFLLQQLENHWDEYRKYITAFECDDLQKLIMTLVPDGIRSYMQTMPGELMNIVTHLLDIKNTDYVADFGAGAGDFLCYAHEQVPEAQYWGNEIGTDACAIAKIRSVLASDNHIEIVQEDMFSGSKSEGLQFDKAFCFPPFGMRLGRMANVENFLRSKPELPIIKGTCSGEWLFALKMLSCLKENGRAVLVMPIGGLFNSLDNEIRKYFLERKMIETVIKLPGKILDFTAIPVALVVFSNKNNEKVTLVDASDIGQKNRRNHFSREDIQTIIAAVNGENFLWSTKVHPLDLVVRGNMDPTHYTKKDIIIPFAAKFEEIIKDSFRGTLISASELDEIKSDKETAYRYLTPAGIQDGVIVDDLMYLSDEAEKYNRYSLQSGDLVISKIGTPFKVAIADVPAGQTIIANGNLFVVRINKAEADPYYIKAFLESSKGQALLARAAVGSTMPMIKINTLREMSIALLPLDQQKEIGSKYLAKMDEIAVLKNKLAKAADALKHIVDDVLEW